MYNKNHHPKIHCSLPSSTKWSCAFNAQILQLFQHVNVSLKFKTTSGHISSSVQSIFSARRVGKRLYSTKMLTPTGRCLMTCLCNRHKTGQNRDVKIIQSEHCSEFWSDLMGLKLDRLFKMTTNRPFCVQNAPRH